MVGYSKETFHSSLYEFSGDLHFGYHIFLNLTYSFLVRPSLHSLLSVIDPLCVLLLPTILHWSFEPEEATPIRHISDQEQHFFLQFC